MSTTATAIDFKEFLKGFAADTCKNYIADLTAIPDDKIGVSPMGEARSPLHFSAECAGFNGMLVSALKGEAIVMPDDAGKEAFYASIDTKEKAIAAIETSTAALVDALGTVSDEALLVEIPMYWGGSMPLYKFAHVAISHMAYHDGQLNYIQSLFGDTEVHWN